MPLFSVFKQHTSTFCSLCAGAELLWELRTGAVPNVFIDSGNTVSSSEIAVYILNHLFKKLNEDCLVQGGEVAEKVDNLFFCIYPFYRSMLSNLIYL